MDVGETVHVVSPNEAKVTQYHLEQLVLPIEMLARLGAERVIRAPELRFRILAPFVGLRELCEYLIPVRDLRRFQSLWRHEAAPREEDRIVPLLA